MTRDTMTPTGATPVGLPPNAGGVAAWTRWPVAARALVRLAGVVVVAVAVLTGLLLMTGHDPRGALSALVSGAFGSSYQLVSVTLVRAVPLALTGLAVAIAFRAGILNIGAEGQLLAGAATSAAVVAYVTARFGGVPDLLAIALLLVAGTIAGALWAGIAAWLRRRFGVLEVISTLMLNFVALYVVGYLVRGPLQEPTRIYPQSPTLPDGLHLPPLVPGTRLHVGAALAVLVAVVLWYGLRHRASGFRVRATGANPRAAAIAGRIDVGRVTTRVFIVSGAIAGLAGAVEYTGTTYALYENLSPGYGYTAIAVALLARLNPLGVLLTAVLFGALDAGAVAMQRDAGVPSVVGSVVNATLILLVLVADRWQQRAALVEQAA